VLNRWQKLFGNLTEKQRKVSTTLRANKFLPSLVGQNAFDFARRRLDLDAFKAPDRRMREIRIRVAVQRVWVVQSQGEKI